MLHSALPARAYLGAYLGAGYFEADPAHHPYVYAAQQHQQQQQQHDSYAAAQRAVFHAWTSVQQHSPPVLRAASPCPLDLSLKPPPPVPQLPPPAVSPIEVDDEEDRRSREEARSQHSAESASICSSSSTARYYPPTHHQLLPPQHSLHLEPATTTNLLDEDVVVDDQDSRSSSHHSSSAGSYHLLQSPLLQSKSAAAADLYYQQQQTPPPPPPAPTHIHSPMTPPSTPSPPQQCPARRVKAAPTSPALTPTSAKDKSQTTPRQKKKHARRLKFDEDTSSPVSGTVILGPDEAVVTGDIDPAFNIVEVTDEARAELAKIENRLGPYQCKLCRQLHEDAFQLAQHRCSRIAHVEYRCPECDKRFSCPANLASHRRWHKPRPEATVTASSPAGQESSLACTRCDAKFARAAALRKHLAQQHPAPEQNNNNNDDEVEEQPGKDAALAMEMA